MNKDAEILSKGLNLLSQKMEITEVERFIMLVNNQGFDYTKWRENLWSESETLESLSQKAQEYYQQQLE
ncbi:hypothetical protein AKJ60_01150 [candidate division MSBL1 archaeon SCGC-AAA385M11]|nr:hypothetical protein AKJ60_01150 [candidate division MSBL1 archaeon SCGC-AAA385M11]